MTRGLVHSCLALILLLTAAGLTPTLAIEAGFAETDITPDVTSKRPVWLAGYGMGRRAKGVHDPLLCRCVVLKHGDDRIALVSVDLVGLQYPAVQQIRAKLPGFKYVMVSSTHNHEGPDVIGIWGRTAFHRGVDDDYIALVVERVVQAVEKASQSLTPVTAAYGTAEDESLLGDSRQPIVKDGVLRVLRFDSLHKPEAQAKERIATEKTPAGILVQWNCHPEALGPRNQLVTADFPWATVEALRKKYNCPIVYMTGAVGGLMAPPRGGRIKDAAGNELREGDYEYARVYGEEVAALAAKAVDAAQPIELSPFVVSARPIAVPLTNVLYRAARVAGVLQRDGLVWTGDFEQPGEPIVGDNADKPTAVQSEVAYLRLGELHVACIPGEIYPELVYGKYQEPADPGADFPDAPLEPSVESLMPGPKWMLFGLANDEVGYIIPKRQWDKTPPYAYGREQPQYGEINSCGPDVAPVLMEALRRRVAEATTASK
ncbi:MAG TPA: hypothetical protein VMP01_02755 [Pirellulaceae bacterium]|nr:hypothetical protein [Pirellulaceae bacterium]